MWRQHPLPRQQQGPKRRRPSAAVARELRALHQPQTWARSKSALSSCPRGAGQCARLGTACRTSVQWGICSYWLNRNFDLGKKQSQLCISALGIGDRGHWGSGADTKWAAGQSDCSSQPPPPSRFSALNGGSGQVQQQRPRPPSRQRPREHHSLALGQTCTSPTQDRCPQPRARVCGAAV